MAKIIVTIGDVPARRRGGKKRKVVGKVGTEVETGMGVKKSSSFIAQHMNGLNAESLAITPLPSPMIVPKDTEAALATLDRIPYRHTKRRLPSGWLQAYLQYTSGQESPSKFHFFAGLSVLAGAVRRHVYLDRGYYTIYPNIYVILVAGSAICRKSTACNIAIDFLHKLKTKHVFHGQASTQGLLDFMANIKHHYCKGVRTQDTSPFIYSDELHVLLTHRSYTEDIVKVFTDFYSGKVEWDYKLKASVVTIKNCSPSILAASTPIWLAKALPPELMDAGLTGRMFFVYEDRGKRIAHPEPPSDKLKAALLHDLVHISNLSGEFIWEEEAKQAFTTWYEGLDMDYDQDVLAAYFARKQDHALKLAMLFAVNESDNLRITVTHWERALQCLSEIEANARLAYQYMGTNEAAMAGEIITALKSLKGVELRSEVYRRVGHKYKNIKQFNEIVDSLVMQKKIKKDKLKTNGKQLLRLERFDDKIAQAEKYVALSKMPRIVKEIDPDTM